MALIVGGTWTYSGNPAASDLDAVRHKIGDTDTTDHLLSDEAILYEIAQTANVNEAAARSAEAISAMFIRLCTSRKVGATALAYQNRADLFAALAEKLREQALSSSPFAAPVAGGISVAAKQAVEDDSDRTTPSFRRGLFDHPDNPQHGGRPVLNEDPLVS